MPAGRAAHPKGNLVFGFELRYFVFYSQFLTFKFGKSDVVGVRPLVFVANFLLERQVSGTQSFDMLMNRHLCPPEACHPIVMVPLFTALCQANES